MNPVGNEKNDQIKIFQVPTNLSPKKGIIYVYRNFLKNKGFFLNSQSILCVIQCV